MTYPAEAIDDWFESLEEAFEGRLADDHPLLRAFGGQGWRVKTMGVDFLMLADKGFPFTKPRAFLETYDATRPRPHIEPIPFLGTMARICLTTPAVPDAPLLAVQSAFSDARQLLRANLDGSEDEDFQNDFASYWSHYLPDNAKSARICGLSSVTTGAGSYFLATDGIYYCFQDKADLRRYAKHLWNASIRDPHQFPIVKLHRLPDPDRYPRDTDTFARLMKRYSVDGMRSVGDMLRERPKRLPVLLSGTGPNGRSFTVGVELVAKLDTKGRPSVKANVHAKLSDDEVIALYGAQPLETGSLDAALTRLPNGHLAATRKKVIIVGCGALGSGIALMLAKAGVTNLVLIDPELLGWENIRRHELGAEYVNVPKVVALKGRIYRSIPEIEDVVAINTSLQNAFGTNPDILADADLVIAATGDWGCDSFLSQASADHKPPIPTIFTWTEAYALATHAILLSGNRGCLSDGFDAVGSFKGQASSAAKPVPSECGNTTSPFGAVEVAQSQALAAKLALEVLGGRLRGIDAWRTLTAAQSTVEDAEGSWSDYWVRHRGLPPALGGVSEAGWQF